jgi:RimJ/RimL family protein N-acetyltransferase
VWSDGVVVLRPWRPDDAGSLAAAWADPEIARWTAVPADRSAEAAARWIAGWDERRRRRLALDLVVAPAAAEATVLGEVGASFVDRPPALGWWVRPEARGQGIAVRAVRLFVGSLLAAGFVTELVADVDADNLASVAVARHAGFEPTAQPGRYIVRRPPSAN